VQGTFEEPIPVRGAFLIGLLLIAGLIFGISLPPVQDYPNHLARYWLIAGGASVPPTSSMFAIDWRNASTNIGPDLIVALLVTVVPYWLAGKLLLVVSFAGPPAAAGWLNKLLFGRWTWWSLSFLLLAWTTTSVYGLVNYQLSLMAALLFACLDTVLLWSLAPKFVARVVFAAASLVIHPFGLIFYILLLLALTIGQTWSGLLDWKRLLQIARDAVWPILAGVIPVASLLLLAPNPPGEHETGVSYFMRGGFSPWRLFLTVASPFVTYRIWIDLLFFAPILAIYLYALVTRRAKTHAGMLTLGLITAALSLVTPVKAGDAGGVDRRLPLMATYLLFAGALPQPFNNRSLQRAAAAGVFGIAVARTLSIGAIWLAREADVRAVETALSEAPAGAAILEVQSEPADVATAPIGRYLPAVPEDRRQPTLIHVPVMAIPWRKAFVPTLFTVPGQQPVRVLPPWTELKSATLSVPDIHIFDASNASDQARVFPFLSNWREKFDYVIAIGMDREDFQGPFTPPQQLSLVANEGYARLYRIQTDRPASGASGAAMRVESDFQGLSAQPK
jgi:hypothetical protein